MNPKQHRFAFFRQKQHTFACRIDDSDVLVHRLGRLLPALALAAHGPVQTACFVPCSPPLASGGERAAAGMRGVPALRARTCCLLRSAAVNGGAMVERPATKHSHTRCLTALNAKKGKGTAPNSKPKKGREAYLAAKKRLEDQRAAAGDSSDEPLATVQPRPGEAEAWTMEEAWQDHNQELSRVMTEAAPDFAKTSAVAEVALGAPEKWWNEVVAARLARIAAAAYGNLAVKYDDLRVLDVGTGTGTMLPHLSSAMPADVDGKVIGVDLCEAMLDIVEDRYPDVPLLNADFSTLAAEDLHLLIDPEDTEGVQASPAEFAASGNGKVDIVVMNAVYSLMLDETDALEAASRLLRRGGRTLISHPLGSAFIAELQRQVPDLIEHRLPSPQHLDEVIKYLPFRRSGPVVDEEEFYMAILERTPERLLEHVLCMRGTVASGWGRGGKKLGVPTANLPESLFPEQLREVPTGVYLGWASVGDRCAALA